MIHAILSNLPWWYYILSIIFSLYYAIRGVIHVSIAPAQFPYTKSQRIFIDYIQEFLFKVIVTMSSFLALAIANYILSSVSSLNDIGAGTAIILVFLFIWGVTGASGYLTLLILMGKIPGSKS